MKKEYKVSVKELLENIEKFEKRNKIICEYEKIIEYFVKNKIEYLSFNEIFDLSESIFEIKNKMSIVSLRNNLNKMCKEKVSVYIKEKSYILCLSKMNIKVNNRKRKRSIYFIKEI
jgi:hypothetical protein